EKLLAAVLADVERARDVGVRDPARELHLLAKPREARRIADELAAQHLERDDLVELEIAHAVDVAHSARADPSEDVVPLADARRRGSALEGARDDGIGTQRVRALQRCLAAIVDHAREIPRVANLCGAARSSFSRRRLGASSCYSDRVASTSS